MYGGYTGRLWGGYAGLGKHVGHEGCGEGEGRGNAMVEMPEARTSRFAFRLPAASGLRGDQTADMRSQAAMGEVEEWREGEEGESRGL